MFEVPFIPMTTQEPVPVTFEVSRMEPASVVTCTLSVLPAKLAVTCGGSGFSPISYSSRSRLISLRLHVHSARLLMIVPSFIAKGFGRLGLLPP